MNRRIFTAATAAFCTTALFLSNGCEKPPPAGPAASSTARPAGDSTDLKSMLAGKPSAAAPPARPERPSAVPPAHPAPGIPTPPSDADPKWNVPEEWTTAEPASPAQRTQFSPLRRIQYLLPRVYGDTEDGDLTVTYWGPGQGGTVATNLERWRGQLTTTDGQPVPDSDTKTENFDANGMKVTLLQVDGRFVPSPMLGGPPPAPRDNYRMLAAMVETPRGPWFFKATGPRATIDKHADAMRTMLRSIRQ